MSQNVETVHYVTALQHGMLYHSLRTPRSGLYVEQFCCNIIGNLHREAFAAAWEAVLQRHDVLRTLFIRMHEPRPMQVVRKQVSVPFEYQDWSELSVAEQERRFQQHLQIDRSRGFELTKAPLLRVWIARVAAQRYRFLLTYHHAVLDGWSMPILCKEVFQLYAARISGQVLSLPKAAPYKSYVNWLREQDSASAREFWHRSLQGFCGARPFARSMAPTLRIPDVVQRTFATCHLTVPPSWREAMMGVCRATKVTLNSVCQAAWSILLGRYLDSDDLVYGTVSSGRPLSLAGVESMLGLFINTLPLRVRLPHGGTLLDFVQHLQGDNAELERYGYLPLADIQQCSELKHDQVLFDTLYVFENYPGQSELNQLTHHCGLQITDLEAFERTNYSLALIVIPQQDLRLQLTYDTAHFSEASIGRMLQRYAQLLEQMLDLEQLSFTQLHWSKNPQLPSISEPKPAAGSILALLERYAAQEPQRLMFTGAVRCTYGELIEQVRCFCHGWQRYGYERGDVVAVEVDDDVTCLALLLSAIAVGIQCVIAQRTLAHGIPVRVHVREQQAVSSDHLNSVSVASLAQTEDSTQNPAAITGGGSCWLVHPDPDGGPVAVQYHEATVLAAMEWFAATYPKITSSRIPVAGRLHEDGNLWSCLFALGSGLTVQHIGDCPAQDFLPKVSALGSWHSIRLNHARTRALSSHRQSQFTLSADYIVVAATALTMTAVSTLHSSTASARLSKEFYFPVHSLPHGVQEVEDEDDLMRLGTAVSGSTLQMLDRWHGLSDVDTYGMLAVEGWSVGGGSQAALRTQLRGWQTAKGAYGALCDIDQCLATANPAMIAIEAQLQREIGAAELGIVEHLNPAGEWRYVLFHGHHIDAGRLAKRWSEVAASLGLLEVECVAVQALPLRRAAIDRHALAHGKVIRLEHDNYVAPRDAVEVQLQQIWQQVLEQQRIGIHDNYFELGGKSLLATVLLYQINEQLSVSLSLETLLEHPTIAALAQRIRHEGTADIDLEARLRADITLDASITGGAVASHSFSNVLLTGANGFLGVHLLSDLLQRSSAHVHCLVMGEQTAALSTLVNALQVREVWDERYRGRLHIVAGSLEHINLGLPAATFASLADRIDAIYHNAAGGNFLYPYDALRQVNVLAIKDLLKLATLQRTKPVFYVSTLDVLDRNSVHLQEQLQVAFHPGLASGYEQSKWVAEQLLVMAAERGVPVTIFRPSRIAGHSHSGMTNTEDFLSHLIKGIIEIGKAPHNAGFDNLVPVDVVSRAIAEFSFWPGAAGRAVHIVNPRWHALDEVIDHIEHQGYRIDRLSYDDWLEQVQQYAKQQPGRPLAMLLPALEKLHPARSGSARRKTVEHRQLDEVLGAQLLESVADINSLLRTYFDHFHASGFIMPPSIAVAAHA